MKILEKNKAILLMIVIVAGSFCVLICGIKIHQIKRLLGKAVILQLLQ